MYTIYSELAVYENKRRICKEKGFYAKLNVNNNKKWRSKLCLLKGQLKKSCFTAML